MNERYCLDELRVTQEFFNRATEVLTEEDRDFAPAEGMMTTAQHFEHVAGTLDWFVEGAFRPEGFDLDFENAPAPVPKGTPLADVRKQVASAFDRARRAFEGRSGADLAVALPPGPVLGGQPRWAVIGGIVDHTAHHRGALGVYARLCGKVPTMPYGDPNAS